MFKLCKAALETEKRALSTRELAMLIIRMKQWDENDPFLRKTVAYRLIQSLTRAAAQGRIADAGKMKNVKLWKLVK